MILFGAAATGLYLLHQVRKVTDSVHCIGKRGEIGMRSRFGEKMHASNGAAVLRATLRLLERVRERPIAYMTSDFFITTIVEHCPDVFDLVKVIGPDEHTYRILNDKLKTYEFAGRYAVASPRTASAHHALDVTNFAYPAILKWNSTDTEFVDSPAYEKTRIVADRDDLERALGHVGGDRSKLLVQQYLADSEYQQISYGGFYSGGRPLASIIVRQLRQYPRGTSSCVVELTDDDLTTSVSAQVARLATALNITGFCEFEFRCSHDGSETYLLDVNPRTWGWVRALGSRYPQLHTLLLGESAPLEPQGRPVLWVHPLRDALALARSRRRPKGLPPTALLPEWRIRNLSVDGLDMLDPLPTVFGWSMGLSNLLSR